MTTRLELNLTEWSKDEQNQKQVALNLAWTREKFKFLAINKQGLVQFFFLRFYCHSFPRPRPSRSKNGAMLDVDEPFADEQAYYHGYDAALAGDEFLPTPASMGASILDAAREAATMATEERYADHPQSLPLVMTAPETAAMAMNEQYARHPQSHSCAMATMIHLGSGY
jgi:hypothetical protein